MKSVESNQTKDLNPIQEKELVKKIGQRFLSEANAALYIFRVGGEINLSVQKEISSFANSSRMIENIAWFN
jgi:hypothetical protein